ncbi:MAG TPA: hypothetical protein VMT67_01020 [Terriglobales bacterium]|nr:hypothetical protein [Terriglobales bacterium]
MPNNLKAKLRRVMDLLDTELGDSDPMVEGMTQEEIEEECPVFAAMQIVVALWQEAPDEEAKSTDADKLDAERYRWLRQQHWNEADMFVVAGSKSQVYLGTDCPSCDRLDAAIDAARAHSTNRSGGQHA